jgi:hypothetical protein
MHVIRGTKSYIVAPILLANDCFDDVKGNLNFIEGGASQCTECFFADVGWDHLITEWVDGCLVRPFTWGSDDERSLEIRHDKPYNPPYSDRIDGDRYRSVLGGIGRALSVLSSDGKSLSERFRQEHDVLHGSTHGFCVPNDGISYVSEEGSFKFQDRTFAYARVLGNPTKVDATGYPGQGYTLLESPERPFFNDVAVSLSDSNPFTEPYQVMVKGWPTTVTISDITMFGDGIDRIGLEYNLHLEQELPPYTITRDIVASCMYSRSWDFAMTEEGTSLVEADVYDPPIGCGSLTIAYHQTAFSKEGPAGPGDCEGGSTFQFCTGTTNCRPLIFGEAGTNWPEPTAFIHRMRERDQTIASKLSDIWSAAYVSSAKAIEHHSEFIKVNWIETISDLDQLFDLYRTLDPLLDVLSAIPRGQLIAGGFRLLDFIVKVYLVDKFVIEPTRRDLIDFATKFDLLLDQLESRLRTKHELRGKFSYEFDDPGHPLDGFEMLVRSKVVIGFPKSSLMNSMLPFEASGVLPTPNRLWESIPLSFVVDWFTNNSTRLTLGQNAVYGMTAEAHYFVHSFSLRKQLTPGELTLADCKAVGSAWYHYYARIKSRYFPAAHTGRYDWLAADSVPKLLGTALLYAFLRK